MIEDTADIRYTSSGKQAKLYLIYFLEQSEEFTELPKKLVILGFFILRHLQIVLW